MSTITLYPPLVKKACLSAIGDVLAHRKLKQDTWAEIIDSSEGYLKQCSMLSSIQDGLKAIGEEYALKTIIEMCDAVTPKEPDGTELITISSEDFCLFKSRWESK